MSTEPLSTEKFIEILDQKFTKLSEERHLMNTHLSSAIGELQIGQSNNEKAVFLLEKNYSELKIIAENTNTILTKHLNSLQSSIVANHEEYKEFKSKYYESENVTEWKLQKKEVSDIANNLNALGRKVEEENHKQDKLSDEQSKKIAQHEKWFYISFGVLFAGQFFFKYLPMLTNIAK
jgi:hypothetical protein